MPDLPPDLARLRTLETYLQMQLDAVRAAIRQAEQQEADDRRRRERARAEQSWKIQPQRTPGEGRAILHRGGCSLWKTQLGYLTREEAVIALELEDPPVECCAICRPETGLRSD